MRFRILVLSVMILFFSAESICAQTEIRLGVLAKRGPEKVYQQWEPMAKYLSRKLSQTVVVLPLEYPQVEPALAKNELHFLLANSGFFVELKDRHGLKALATMVNRYRNVAISEFGGVIFTRKDSPIEQLGDLRGKRFMCASVSSFGGGQSAWRLLLESGINPKKDFTEFLEGGIHDNVVVAVLNRQVDAGTVRTDTLEKMQDEGRIKVVDLKIIHSLKDNFPLIHSTRLYPEWPFIACKPADKEMRRQVTKALRLLNPDHEVMVAARVQSWTYPGDYNAVTECLERIKRAK